MAPVIRSLRDCPDTSVVVISSGQHRELLPQALAVFGLRADLDAAAMVSGQGLAALSARVLEGVSRALTEVRPDLVLVHGDTTTTMSGALAGFYQRIPVGHVEAGLRTGERYSPFPEEMNRLLADRIADLHFAPTQGAAAHLAAEGIDQAGVHVTGNTGIDALLSLAGPRRRRPKDQPRLVVVEAHRRENLGEPMRGIAEAVRRLVQRRADVEVVWSVHPNPEVEVPVRSVLRGLSRVDLRTPPAYGEWAQLLAEADLLLTDSGGLQEEAPALGVPVLVLRESTERPEVVTCGAGRLVGTEPERILTAALELLEDETAYAQMTAAGSPFGDGQAARRTLEGLLFHFGLRSHPPAAFVPAAGVVD